MQRKFLEDLGLEKDVIDKIMSENGNDINSTKHRLEGERDNYKTQLSAAQEALKGFEGVDIKDLQGRIATLTQDLAAKEAEYQNRLADVEFESMLDRAISTSGTRSEKALKALLDVPALKASKNRSEDIKAAIEAVKAENDFLFGAGEPINNPVRGTENAGGNSPLAAVRAAMGLPGK